jgi:tRNA G18 (ribose-2'-O)-methylase SpoU
VNPGDPTLFASLRDRDLRNEGIFIAEGRILTDRLIRAGIEIASILCTPRFKTHYQDLLSSGSQDSPATLIVRNENEVQSIAGFAFHRGVLAAGPRPAGRSLESILGAVTGHPSQYASASATGATAKPTPHSSIVAVCIGISNAANLGSIFRSALTFGADGVICDPKCGDAFSRIALKSSMGASLLLPSVNIHPTEELIESLRNSGHSIISVERDTRSISLREYVESMRKISRGNAGATGTQTIETGRKLAVIFGNEGWGVPEEWLDASEAIVEIPIGQELDSLNVSVSAGIVLYDLATALKPNW